MRYESNPVIDFESNGKLDKDAWFENIIEMCDDMEAYDTLVIYNFGRNGDLLLEAQKDPDYKGGDEWNIVRIWTSKMIDGRMEEVDDTEDVYVADGSLFEELNRIWNEKEFSLID